MFGPIAEHEAHITVNHRGDDELTQTIAGMLGAEVDDAHFDGVVNEIEYVPADGSIDLVQDSVAKVMELDLVTEVFVSFTSNYRYVKEAKM